PCMRERGAEVATTQMGRMGAEDPSRIPGAVSGFNWSRAFLWPEREAGGNLRTLDGRPGPQPVPESRPNSPNARGRARAALPGPARSSASQRGGRRPGCRGSREPARAVAGPRGEPGRRDASPASSGGGLPFLELLSGKTRERLTGQPVDGPTGVGARAHALVETDGVLVPVEDCPLEAAPPPLARKTGKTREQQPTDALASVLRDH